jgi:hypothetical protein
MFAGAKQAGGMTNWLAETICTPGVVQPVGMVEFVDVKVTV